MVHNDFETMTVGPPLGRFGLELAQCSEQASAETYFVCELKVCRLAYLTQSTNLELTESPEIVSALTAYPGVLISMHQATTCLLPRLLSICNESKTGPRTLDFCEKLTSQKYFSAHLSEREAVKIALQIKIKPQVLEIPSANRSNYRHTAQKQLFPKCDLSFASLSPSGCWSPVDSTLPQRHLIDS